MNDSAPYTVGQRVFLVNKKIQREQYKNVQFEFKRTFPFCGKTPDRKTGYRNVKKFGKEGTVLNQNRGRSGRKRSVLTDTNMQIMKNMIENESNLPARVARSSCRKHRLPFPMSKSSFNRGIQKLEFHPYKLIYKHKLKEADYPKRASIAASIAAINFYAS